MFVQLKTLYQFACINLLAESYLRNKKEVQSYVRSLDILNILALIAVKQNVLVLSTLKTKAKDKRYSLWLAVRSSLQKYLCSFPGKPETVPVSRY